MLVELVRESISDAEQRKAAIETELETLREIEELAGKLNGGGTVPSPAPSETSRPAASRSTQPRGAKAADPPSRPPASRSSQTSARRAPTAPSSGPPKGSAPAGGGRQRHSYDAAEILEKTREAIARTFQSVTFSVSEIVRELGYPDKNDRALAAVRQAVLYLVDEKVIAEAGKGRGGHPRYAVVQDHSSAAPSGLVGRLLEQIEVADGRISRVDLKARVGNPDFDEFESALEQLLDEKKIRSARAGGVAGFELAR